MNVIDIIIIVILAIFTLAGFIRGFLSSLLKLFSSVASLAIAIWLAKPVAVFIDSITNATSWFGDKIGEALAGADGFFNMIVGTDIGTVGNSITGVELKGFIDTTITELGQIFKTVLSLFVQDTSVLESGTVLSEWFGSLLGGVATLIVAAVAIFIAIRIVIAILSKIFDAITQNSAIGGLDRLLGLVFGAAKGALVVAVLFAILSVVIILPGVENLITPLIDEAVIGEPIFNYVLDFIETQLATIDFNALIQGAFASITG